MVEQSQVKDEYIRKVQRLQSQQFQMKYSYLKWSNGSTENPLIITINSTQTISATFELIEFQFNYFIDENSLPQDWIDEFNKIDAYLKNLLPVYAFLRRR